MGRINVVAKTYEDSKDLQEYMVKYMRPYDSSERLDNLTFDITVPEQEVDRFCEFLDDQKNIEWELM